MKLKECDQKRKAEKGCTCRVSPHDVGVMPQQARSQFLPLFSLSFLLVSLPHELQNSPYMIQDLFNYFLHFPHRMQSDFDAVLKHFSEFITNVAVVNFIFLF
jgi:hypothetical protein